MGRHSKRTDTQKKDTLKIKKDAKFYFIFFFFFFFFFLSTIWLHRSQIGEDQSLGQEQNTGGVWGTGGGSPPVEGAGLVGHHPER